MLSYLLINNVKMKEDILRLKKEGKTYNEIKQILGCSISTISYHCNNNNLGTDMKLSDELIKKIKDYYLNHTINETISEFNISKTTLLKYCDKKRVILSDGERKKLKVTYVQNRRIKLKLMAIEYKGGCCEICGYNKSNWALGFHHINPTEKDFNIGYKGYTRSWEKVKKEIDKCMLVCSNCHAEIHEKQNKGLS